MLKHFEHFFFSENLGDNFNVFNYWSICQNNLNFIVKNFFGF